MATAAKSLGHPRVKVPVPDERIKMYARISDTTRKEFKQVAKASGETMEGRLERVMRQDIEANRHLLGAKSPRKVG